MGRPPKDPSGSATETVTFRVSAADRALLDRLVTLRAQELVDEGVEVTIGSYFRALIRREARSRGLLDDPATVVSAAKKEASAEEVHARLLEAIEAGVLQKDLAREARIEMAGLSRFKNGKNKLEPEALRRLSSAIVKLRR